MPRYATAKWPALWIVVLSTILALPACSAQRPPASVDAEVTDSSALGMEATSPETAARVRALWTRRTRGGVPTDICLGSGDLLDITVFHWAEMSGLRARVSSTGFISLPLLGEIQAAGKTERALQEEIARRLRDGIMKRPSVTVFVAEYASQQVSVTGAVGTPGLISLSRERRTLSDVLSEAGGLSETAGGKLLFYPANRDACALSTTAAKIPLSPPSNVTPIALDVNEDYASAFGMNPLALPVIGGDAVVVNRGRFFVSGWVNSPGAYDISPGVTAFGALSAAGGAMFPANLSKVVVWRNERGGRKLSIPVDVGAIEGGNASDVSLQAGDVISVPPSIIKMVPYSGYWLATNVIRVGAGLSLTGL